MSNGEKVKQDASDMYDALQANGATKTEAVLAIAYLLSMIVEEPAHKEAAPPIEPPKHIQQPKKSVSYDPVYDPPPPFSVDTPPTRAEAPERKLADSNRACICDSCHKVVYITNKPIMNGMTVPDFIAAFTPTEGFGTIAKTTEIENIDGNIACDCPACGAKKKLYLTGGPAL